MQRKTISYGRQANITVQFKKNSKYHKDSCIRGTFLLKFWAKNDGCGLYMKPLLSERVNWLSV